MMPPSTGEMTQLAAIVPILGQFAIPIPPAAMPAPSTPPTMEWVVDTGAQRGGDIEPDGAGQQCRHHDPDEHFRIVDQRGVYDAFLDGADDIPAGNQCACCFEGGGNDDGACHREGAGANGGPYVVGDIIGADVQGHVAADHGGCNQHQSVMNLCEFVTRVHHDQDDEHKSDTEPEQFGTP